MLRVFDKDRGHAVIVNSRLRPEATPWHASFEMPKDRLTINLAPADIKKEGPIFDLPIALGVLATMGDIRVWYLPHDKSRWYDGWESLIECVLLGDEEGAPEVRYETGG